MERTLGPLAKPLATLIDSEALRRKADPSPAGDEAGQNPGLFSATLHSAVWQAQEEEALKWN